MDNKSLGSLPDEVVLEIVDKLDTARDVARLGRSARRFHNLMQQDAWRTFVQTRFPSLRIPSHEGLTWDAVADRLTYLDRCWEKRGFGISCFCEKSLQGRRQRRPGRHQSVTYHAVVDVKPTPSLDHELIAAGVGENLLLRLKPQRGQAEEVWSQLRGEDEGYLPGSGDVTAISVIDRGGELEVITGRANGDIRVLSLTNDGAQSTLELLPVDDSLLGYGSDPMKRSPGQVAVSWTEWHPERQLLASSKGSLLTLHDVGEATSAKVGPIAHYDFSPTSMSNETCLLRSIKFMGRDTVVCALGGSQEPLRWAKLTPTNLEFFNAASNPKPLEDAATLTEVRLGEKTTVRAIQPVEDGGSGNMLLSAWDDGTYRLIDVRTPSPHDAVYRDRFQPYEAGSSLLVYGTERFIAGSNTAPDIRLFDFRYPKPYFHTTASPCSPRWPLPEQWHDQQVLDAKSYPSSISKCCDPQRGTLCPWHCQVKWDYRRPDATIHIGNPMYDRIYSLAKASDMSDAVYCGVRGAILEMNLRLTGDSSSDMRHGAPTPPDGWRSGFAGGKISLIETGVSLCQAPEWSLEDRGIPKLVVQDPTLHREAMQGRAKWRKEHHRLDHAFHQPLVVMQEEPFRRREMALAERIRR